MKMLTISKAWAFAIGAWDEYLRSAGHPKDTRYTRTYHLRRFGADHAKLSPWSVTLDHLLAWTANKDWSPNTRRSYRVSLRVFFTWAHARGHMPSNPAFELPKVSVPRALPRPAPNDVVDDGLRTLDIRVRLMILILADTGIRRGELCKVHTRDLERDLMGWTLRVVGKGGHVRVVPIDERLATAIDRMPRGYLFPGQIDGHLSAPYVGKLVSRALADGWTAHTLRHRFASLAYAVDKDIRAVQELLGHASVSTTQIYTLVLPDAMRRAAAGARVGLTAA
ncbi:tyrosine-type recombinase/integrase [Rhodococcoides corynebacterioides]|uniref:tyrosine-type recombinase/integrase n=1 Tax=Rhodococcoides corynebacterioides TaxID=53972 RepID=UPI003F816C6E